MRATSGTQPQHGLRKRALRPVPIATAVLTIAAGGVLVPVFAQGSEATCSVKYSVGNTWRGGFQGSVTVTNKGKPAKNWTLAFDFPSGQKIVRGSNADWSQKGSKVTVRGAGANRTLATGDKVRAGFVASGAKATPSRFKFNGAVCDSGKSAPAGPSSSASASASVKATASGSPSASPTTGTPTTPASSQAASDGTLASRLSVSKITLPSSLSYLEAGYNQQAEWTRVDTQAAPDGTVKVAWPAADGIHVTPLTPALARDGADTVVPGTKEVGGLVAHNDGFALLTRVSDTNKWDETAAALVRYKNGSLAFDKKLTGTASNDTSPVLDSQLKWNGSKYGAYFVVHGAGGWADGHFGDKLAYVNDSGTTQDGGWDWGCSHNEGIALHPESSGAFTSLCFDDWRSGLLVSTGIGAPDDAPVVQREECWAGYCGGTYPGRSGDLVKSATGRYATAWASRGAASAVKNPEDSSGRGWKVTPKTDTHQVTVAFLKDGSTPDGDPVQLTDDAKTDHVNVRIAPYGKNLLVSWEEVTDAVCKSGTCTGKFGGTHLRVIDYDGKTVAPDEVVDARIAGDIAVLPDSSLAWAFTAATPDYSSGMSGSSPTSSTLSIARLKN
ncbi:cellulose binding domain-containing protein [Streptomyces fulvoviolaceus]|uniref:cellulose binding domain-containing protein n=1 Tax=Streptomyces fulvoviolaceus TaxID=285535 RepID=UPI000997977E|nr:cellulose binding domain-containing protein [Streptomyces fulvoviolaceus]